MNYYLEVFKKYAVFSGRARRSEYWYFTLFNFIVSIILAIISSIAGDKNGLIGIAYALVVFIPGIALSVRRLHDVNKSGWMLLILLIPFVGAIWLLVLMCTDGDMGDNEYGPNPKILPSFSPSEQPTSTTTAQPTPASTPIENTINQPVSSETPTSL
jgi:uncharacterized membrane protein YhaH (DUF805 family)